MIFETSWDDNSVWNKRLAHLLKKYKVGGTFYLSAKGLHKSDLPIYKGFEIGGHSYSHPQDLKILTPKQKSSEIVASKSWLEKFTNRTINKFCYPRGRFNDECVRLVRYAGYIEARTTKVLATEVQDRFRKATTIHWYPRKEYQGRPVLEVAKEYYDIAKRENKYFHLWGHSWEIEKLNLWGKLEEFLIYVTED